MKKMKSIRVTTGIPYERVTGGKPIFKKPGKKTLPDFLSSNFKQDEPPSANGTTGCTGDAIQLKLIDELQPPVNRR